MKYSPLQVCEGADQFYPVDAVELSRAKEIMQELKATRAEIKRVFSSSILQSYITRGLWNEMTQWVISFS